MTFSKYNSNLYLKQTSFGLYVSPNAISFTFHVEFQAKFKIITEKKNLKGKLLTAGYYLV
ncbi:hypothetical protein BpHYR1_049204 [Brachionus plicatilis]|uniref:Uncharacterized protein n=1 Tax=Brachionus plicatilis TaxID=10195 RepID=A0A3M7PIN9_BRAPC|nr:hypothetical protein BpHYR1_049204 [Brachionus plicatilis]